MTPAASIRLAEGKRKKLSVPPAVAGGLARFFDPPATAGGTDFSPRSDVHHSVNTITANGMPSRNPRCVTSRLVIELPQRHAFSISGRIVYECGRCLST